MDAGTRILRDRRYNASDKGRARKARYRATTAGRVQRMRENRRRKMRALLSEKAAIKRELQDIRSQIKEMTDVQR